MRFKQLSPAELTPEQRKLAESLIAGPRGGGQPGEKAGEEAIAAMLKRGPFNAWMRSPELGELLQKVGEQIRYRSSLPARLNEFAILVTARHWSSQYEWYAHRILALKAGLRPQLAAELAENRRPSGMEDDEAAVYDFCTELHREKRVSDATFARVRALFGERGVVDLVGVCGYYGAVSMTLNVAQVPLPDGQPDPLR